MGMPVIGVGSLHTKTAQAKWHPTPFSRSLPCFSVVVICQLTVSDY